MTRCSLLHSLAPLRPSCVTVWGLSCRHIRLSLFHLFLPSLPLSLSHSWSEAKQRSDFRWGRRKNNNVSWLQLCIATSVIEEGGPQSKIKYNIVRMYEYILSQDTRFVNLLEEESVRQSSCTEYTFSASGVSLVTFLGTKQQNDMIVAVGFGDSCPASIDHDGV